MPLGRARHTHSALSRPSSATKAKALRQPSMPLIKLPSGIPRTDARDQPRKMKVMARPRWCAGTSRLTQAAAWGVKMAGATAASTRSSSSEVKSGISALRPRNSAYQSMVSASRRRRSQPATTLANSGAPTHIMTAAAVMSCPATATGTASELLISLRVPETTMTPLPMTKLPNSKGHRTLGSDALGKTLGMTGRCWPF